MFVGAPVDHHHGNERNHEGSGDRDGQTPMGIHCDDLFRFDLNVVVDHLSQA